MNFRKFRHLSSDELQLLARLCGGVASLVLIVLVLSGSVLFVPQSVKLAEISTSSQTASTWLGQQQGVPPDSASNPYPALTSCAIDTTCNDGYGYGGVPAQCLDYPGDNVCSGGNQPSSATFDDFYTGVFSAHSQNVPTGETAYIQSAFNG